MSRRPKEGGSCSATTLCSLSLSLTFSLFSSRPSSSLQIITLLVLIHLLIPLSTYSILSLPVFWRRLWHYLKGFFKLRSLFDWVLLLAGLELINLVPKPSSGCAEDRTGSAGTFGKSDQTNLEPESPGGVHDLPIVEEVLT